MSDTSPITKEELIAALVSASEAFCSDSDDSVRNTIAAFVSELEAQIELL